MTLKERIDSDSRLKNWMIPIPDRPPGVAGSPAGTPKPDARVVEFKDESLRFSKAFAAQASPGAVEFIARRTGQDENRLYQTDVH
ncbi:MAG TPA: hypothetical protein VMU54_14210 [Planctomycetota bacterium]|nr:hypothetical protein [Planctomycetota bacterium]